MDIRTYRAKSMQEALALVRRDLGPQAAVLHTRDVRTPGLLGLISGSRSIEVTASNEVAVPSRLPPRVQGIDLSRPDEVAAALGPKAISSRHRDSSSSVARPHFGVEHHSQHREDEVQSRVDEFCDRTRNSAAHALPASLFDLFTDLIEADVQEETARELLERVRRELPARDLNDMSAVQAYLARIIEDQIKVTGPIQIEARRQRIVALVGPTGVGKTTTVAKLAANYRLKEKRRVGLITVDTYRIAAVDQLRTYADIIDLPMAVVATPREMREAVKRMSDLELVLMDTAGRSPRDEVRIQELKSMLGRGAGRRGASGLERGQQCARSGTDCGAICRRRYDRHHGDQAGRGARAGKPTTDASFQRAADQLCHQWTECARRHCGGRCAPTGASGVGF
ncbi:MAG: flagellar biosynthesis protein FlhF [Planctomycetota bacterium]|nr:flagellar biosynthesis protein FlhF [Planctomycetota bacterium]